MSNSFIDDDLLEAIPVDVVEAAANYGLAHGFILRQEAEQGQAPYPDRDNPMLAYLVRGAQLMVAADRCTPSEAIIHVAVHAWYEGHLEGREQAEANK